jgi:NADH:ubiquinone oxidoreductase subunit 4 (subunit M)
VTVVALWGALVIGGIYMTRAIRNILHGPVPEKWNSLSDASNAWRKLPYALLLASLLVFGFLPKLLTEKINPDAQKIVSLATVAQPSRLSSLASRRRPPLAGTRAGARPQAENL